MDDERRTTADADPAIRQQDVHQLPGQAKRRATKIRPNAVRCGIYGRFLNFYKCRLEVVSGTISIVALECVGFNVRVKFADVKPNRSGDIRAAHFVIDDERRRRMPNERRRRTQVIT